MYRIGEILLFGTITFGLNFSIIPSFKLSVEAGESILSVIKRTPIIPTYTGDQFEVLHTYTIVLNKISAFLSTFINPLI